LIIKSLTDTLTVALGSLIICLRNLSICSTFDVTLIYWWGILVFEYVKRLAIARRIDEISMSWYRRPPDSDTCFGWVSDVVGLVGFFSSVRGLTLSWLLSIYFWTSLKNKT